MRGRPIPSAAIVLIFTLVVSAALSVGACNKSAPAENEASAIEANAENSPATVAVNTGESTNDFATDVNATDMNATVNATEMNATGNFAPTAPPPVRCSNGELVPANAPCPAEASPNNAEVMPGKGSFTKPPAMELGTTWYTIEFHTGPNEQAISEQAQGAETTAPQPIHISRLMKVVLDPDPNFRIKEKTPEEQDTGADWAATWAWDVQPINEGVHTLMAHVEVMMHDPSGKLVHYDQYDSRVAVQVRVGSWRGLLNALANARTLGDALTTLFRSWRGTLVALAALITAAFGVRAAIHAGRKPPKGDDGQSGSDQRSPGT